MARASDDSAEVMRFGSVSGNVAGNDEHGSEYTVDFGLSEGDDFQGFESGAWVFNARNIPEGTYSVPYTITDEEGVGGAALQIKVEGTPPGFPTDGGGSGDDSGGDGGAGGDGDSDGGGDGNGPPNQPRSFNAVELTLLSMDVHRAGEDGTDGNAEWSLDVRVVPPPVSAFGTPQFLLDENRFQFRERAVDDGDRIIFDQRDDNTFFFTALPSHTATILATGQEDDGSIFNPFGLFNPDDTLPSVVDKRTFSSDSSFDTTASNGDFSYTLHWSADVETLLV